MTELIKAKPIIVVAKEDPPKNAKPIPPIKKAARKKRHVRRARLQQDSSDDEPEPAPYVPINRVRNNALVQNNGIESPDRSDDTPPEELSLEEEDMAPDFWKIIESFTGSTPRAVIARLSKKRREAFTETYNMYYDAMLKRLEDDDMFGRNEIKPHDQPRIVSYSLSVGQEQYETLYNDLEMFQTQILYGDCEGLNNKMPAELQKY